MSIHSMQRPTRQRSRTQRSLLSGIVLMCLVGLAGPIHTAHAEVIERVVAVINEEAVLLSELRRKAVPFLPQVAEAPTEAERMARMEQLYTQLLGNLVDEHLIEQTARKMQIHLTAVEIDRAIENVREQSGLDEADFWEAVREQGLTRAHYRSDVRKQLLRLKVLNQRVRSRVNVTEEDVRERYDEMLRGARRSLRFRAAHVFFQAPDGASATEMAQLRRQIQDVRASLSAKNFFETVEAYDGGELGWLSQGDLPGELEGTLMQLEEGTVSDPVRGPAGYHIFLLQERQHDASSLPPFEETRDPLYRKMVEEAMARQEQMFLEELRRKAIVDKRL